MNPALPADALRLIAGKDPAAICLLAAGCRDLRGVFGKDAAALVLKRRAIIQAKLEVFSYFESMWTATPRGTRIVREGDYGNVRLQYLNPENPAVLVEAFRNGRYAIIRMDRSPSMLLLSVTVMVEPETNLRGHMRVTFIRGHYPKTAIHVGYHRGVVPALISLGVVGRQGDERSGLGLVDLEDDEWDL